VPDGAALRVGIDAQLARGSATGIGEYLAGLIPALRGAGVEAVALDSARLDPWRFDRRVLWDQVLLPIRAAAARIDLVHCAAGTMPLLRTVPAVATVHDVAWLHVQQHARPYARAYFGSFQLARYRSAARIMVDSSFSRAQLLELGGFDAGKVSVVYPGVAADVAAIERLPDAEPFALAVGTVEKRKNLEVVIEALAGVPGLRLVVVGPATPYQELCVRLAAERGVAERIEFRGYVSRGELRDLYARATVVVVPSRYEGFGYAVAQARCAGVPFVAANSSSLPEVADDAGPVVSPDDAEAWAAALGGLLEGRAAAEARASGDRSAAILRFAWSTAAARVAAVYEAALAEP
jgi:glycosyltransferase involved in cell wall biosynthesis